MHQRYPLALLCWILVILVFAQPQARFDHLGRKDGLSQNSVNCMLKDRDGFMWFGTQDGLNLYDGKKFRVFQNQPGDTASLANNYIVSFCEDDEGFLWVGTMTGGLNSFDKHKEKFRVFKHIDGQNSLSENTVWALMSDGKGNVWAGTSKGLNRYNKKSGKFTVFNHNPSYTNSIAADMVVSLFKDSQQRLWVGTVDGLCLLNSKGDGFKRYRNPLEDRFPGSNIIWSISETLSGQIITGTNNGIYLLNIETGDYKPAQELLKHDKLVAWSVISDHSGLIWAGTDKGLFRIEMNLNKQVIYFRDPSDPYSINDNNIWCLLADSSEYLWAGTNNGISKFKTSSFQFGLLNSELGQNLRLSSSRVMAILEDKSGYLWIGTDGGGLNCIDPEKKKVRVYNAANSGLSNDAVWALAEDANGDIYIGNYQGGLHRLIRETGIIKAYPTQSGDSYSLLNNRVLTLLAANDGKLWIGTRGGGLSRLDPISGRFTNFLEISEVSLKYPATTVLAIAEDKRGRIWSGTYGGGLVLYRPETNDFKMFRHDKKNKTSLSDDNVWAIAFDQKGYLWVGTQGGLNFCENNTKELVFRNFTTLDGLRNNTILGIEEDQQGNIWISSFNGLTKLNLQSFESNRKERCDIEEFPASDPLFSHFDTDHGLQGLEFNHGSCYRGKDGTLYFGGNNGLNHFSPESIKPSSFNPPVLITGMKVLNREVLIDSEPMLSRNESCKISKMDFTYFLPTKINYIRSLILTYRESVISFEFASLDFSNPEKNQYAYKLVNFDKEWNYMGSQNTATYTNLDPGEYTFLVRGSNCDGIWSSNTAELNISIIPPYWRTKWFISVIILIVLIIVVLVIRQIFVNQHRKAFREKELIELQLKYIKSQIDPHFAFNAINTIASFIYSAHPDVTYDYFTRFARMIRSILEDNEKISRKLSEEIDFVRNYLDLQKMRFKSGFDYDIKIADNISGDTNVPKMMIQSYAENAIKHGLMHRREGGRLSIDISGGKTGLQVIIEDNGVGRIKAAELNQDSTHRGYRIMEQINELYKKLYQTGIRQEIEDIIDDIGNPSGTRVTLAIIPEKKGRTNWFDLKKKFKQNGTK